MIQHTKDFIQRIASAASQDMQRFGILASVTMAQAILESGWGASELATHANALFGIKADKRWSGKTYSIQTKEWYDGKNPVVITDSFRAYDSWEASITDHSRFLTSSERYQRVVHACSYQAACTELQCAGYSTDPEYAKKLMALIERYQLTQYDKESMMQGNKKLANHKNFGGARNAVRFIVVHYTANKGDTAKNNADYFAREKVGASAHFFVDETEVWESVPETGVAWHCGAKQYKHSECRNANSIGVEICMNDRAGKIRQGSIDHAARLVRELMQRYKIPPEHVLRHYDVTGKCCPRPMVDNPDLWRVFKNNLTEVTEMRYQYYEDMPEWAKATVSKLVKKGYLKGEGNGVLDLSEDALKLLVINDRAGLYGTDW